MVPSPKQRSLEKEEEDLETELTGHLQHLVEEVDDEEELVYTLQQLADNVKHEKRKHAVLAKVIRDNLCEEIAKAIDKMDCTLNLEGASISQMEDSPSSKVIEEKVDCILNLEG